MRAKASLHTRFASDQDRHLMTHSLSIDHHADTRDSCWFLAGNADARIAVLHSQLAIPPTSSPIIQPDTPGPRLRPSIAANRSPRPSRTNHIHPLAAAKSP
jgi:hypothetical protein